MMNEAQQIAAIISLSVVVWCLVMALISQVRVNKITITRLNRLESSCYPAQED